MPQPKRGARTGRGRNALIYWAFGAPRPWANKFGMRSATSRTPAYGQPILHRLINLGNHFASRRLLVVAKGSGDVASPFRRVRGRGSSIINTNWFLGRARCLGRLANWRGPVFPQVGGREQSSFQSYASSSQSHVAIVFVNCSLP